MIDYKTAKEAFVADNRGASILSINAVSLAAVVRSIHVQLASFSQAFRFWIIKELTFRCRSQTTYALYAVATHRFRPNPIVDYLITVLPLLVAITIAANHSFSLNIALAIVAVLLSWTAPRPRLDLHVNGHSHVPGKSKGKWLEESDSDEEPAVIARNLTPQNGRPVQLPSQVVFNSSRSTLSPSTSPSFSPDDLTPSRSRRRRHSPTPSTYTHTAIDVLPTPELAQSSFLPSQGKTYPSAIGQKAGLPSEERLPFLSVYRAHMMVMTIHCILAVDFPVFPRSQGKCENFGTSLVSFAFTLNPGFPPGL